MKLAHARDGDLCGGYGGSAAFPPGASTATPQMAASHLCGRARQVIVVTKPCGPRRARLLPEHDKLSRQVPCVRSEVADARAAGIMAPRSCDCDSRRRHCFHVASTMTAKSWVHARSLFACHTHASERASYRPPSSLWTGEYSGNIVGPNYGIMIVKSCDCTRDGEKR